MYNKRGENMIKQTTYRIPLPLLVFDQCPSPDHLAVWIAHFWFDSAFPRTPIPDSVVAERARVPVEQLPDIHADLVARGLGDRANGYYRNRPLIELEMNSSHEAEAIVSAWQQRLPTPPPPESLRTAYMFADDLVSPEEEEGGAHAAT
jgi:hypothetical protein